MSSVLPMYTMIHNTPHLVSDATGFLHISISYPYQDDIYALLFIVNLGVQCSIKTFDHLTCIYS